MIATVLALIALPSFAQSLPALELSLSDVIQRGVTQNLDLQGERQALARGVAGTRSARVTYSPTLVLRSGVLRDRPFGTAPPLSVFTYSAGASWFSPLGTQVTAEAAMSQPVTSSSAGDPNASSLTFGVAQPLLKDGWSAGASQPLREAAFARGIQRELFRQSLNALIFDLEVAYWDLVVAEAEVQIKTRSRQRAQQQYEDTAENIKRGLLAEVEIYVVQENVVIFDQELLQTRFNLAVARRRLNELLQQSPGAAVQPTQTFVRSNWTVAGVDELTRVAMDRNPRITAQRARQQLAQSRQSYARNQALPKLDLAASVSFRGTDPAWGASWGNGVSNTPQTQVGLVFALPLDRDAVSGSVDVAEAEAQRQQFVLQSEEQSVRHEVLNAEAELKTNLELLTLTEKQLELAELKLAAETEKYRGGISTLADVVRFQRELDNASLRLRRVFRSVYVVRARLLVSQGTLHEAFGVEVK